MGLRETRRRIESLADGGPYRVASARTGEPPVPAAGLRFPDRETAATAARLTRTYRAALRRWDPALSWVDPIVHDCRAPPADRESTTGRSAVSVEGER
ncbi:hypothetical protein EI982_18155 [Haloplanus rallus]|jgi:hypothetical protein|uniref:DUF7552 domain-containing protein n=1 Tax=Haloplanus rallus TaxID=1816183 RepID=A0A6B9F7M7_9EURY|nr:MULTISPECIES: hypothetical protein [Haloplanus]QGX96565.1 hypothetical protein EI982_18155 [Haloplanus rallus]